jgi:hypothetical protein
LEHDIQKEKGGASSVFAHQPELAGNIEKVVAAAENNYGAGS